MRKFKRKSNQQFYNKMRQLAADVNSELYQDGQPRTGTIHRSAFWAGAGKTPGIMPKSRTTAWAAYLAGQDFARDNPKTVHGLLTPHTEHTDIIFTAIAFTVGYVLEDTGTYKSDKQMQRLIDEIGEEFAKNEMDKNA